MSKTKTQRSCEEQVEDSVKDYLKAKNIKYYTKTDKINDDIPKPLKNTPVKEAVRAKTTQIFSV